MYSLTTCTQISQSSDELNWVNESDVFITTISGDSSHCTITNITL